MFQGFFVLLLLFFSSFFSLFFFSGGGGGGAFLKENKLIDNLRPKECNSACTHTKFTPWQFLSLGLINTGDLGLVLWERVMY